MAGAIRQRFVATVKLGATGGGSVSFTARGDVLIQLTRVVVVAAGGGTPVNQSTAMIDVNGDDLDGSETANNDTSDTQHLMLAGDVLTCTWSGGDVNATATLTLRGIQYEAGAGMAAISGGA